MSEYTSLCSRLVRMPIFTVALPRPRYYTPYHAATSCSVSCSTRFHFMPVCPIPTPAVYSSILFRSPSLLFSYFFPRLLQSVSCLARSWLRCRFCGLLVGLVGYIILGVVFRLPPSRCLPRSSRRLLRLPRFLPCSSHFRMTLFLRHTQHRKLGNNQCTLLLLGVACGLNPIGLRVELVAHKLGKQMIVPECNILGGPWRAVSVACRPSFCSLFVAAFATRACDKDPTMLVASVIL